MYAMNRYYWIILMLNRICQLAVQANATKTPIVTLKDGSQLQGLVRPYLKNQQTAVWEFLGIPYASAPVGPLRFLPPTPSKAWKGVLQATTRAPLCEQKIEGSYLEAWMTENNLLMSEDCLHLNVWVPTRTGQNNSTSLPVLVAVHGGGFYAGSSLEPRSDGKMLAGEENVIIVSMAYRLSIFGFLYSGESDAPGNVGLLDQLEALKWVHNNIEAFGGDRNQVTLMGLSAGSASVSLHTMSPLSQPYFNRIILMSGYAISPWVITDRKESKKRLVQVAVKVGCMQTTTATVDCSKVCNAEDCSMDLKQCHRQQQIDKALRPEDSSSEKLSDVVRCLRSKPAQELIGAFDPLTEDFVHITFTPVVDGHFLQQHPSKTLAQGGFKKADIIVGTTTNEGTDFVFMYYIKSLHYDTQINMTNKSFRTMLTSSIEPRYRRNDFVQKAVYMEYEKFEYANLTDDRLLALDEIGTDVYFACDANKWAKRYSEAANTYNVFRYVFDYGDQNKPKWLRSMHAADWPFVFGLPIILNRSKNDAAMSRRIMRYWANFIRTGNPNKNPDGSLTDPKWPPYGKEENYIKLDLHQRAGRFYQKKRCTFWQDFIPDLHRNSMRCSGLTTSETTHNGGRRNISDVIRKNSGAFGTRLKCHYLHSFIILTLIHIGNFR